jgi:uncharacterized membrane protein
MRNKKQWLIIKGVLILILVLVIVGYPTQDSFRKWFRFIMLIVFVISFINDVNRFRKNND